MPRLPTLLFAFLLATHAPMPVRGYSGGPSEVKLLGYEADRERVWYQVHFRDESGRAAETFYIELADSAISEPKRERSLEHPDRFNRSQEVSDRWRELMQRTVPMEGLRDFELKIELKADSMGVHDTFDLPVFRIAVRLGARDRSTSIVDTAYCDTLVKVEGIYRVPNRDERFVVLSFKGNPYYCEPSERLVRLPASADSGGSP